MNCLYLLLLLCCCNRRNNGNGCGTMRHECRNDWQNCECAACLARNERANVKREREERRMEERWERDSLPRPFPPFPEKRDCDCDSGV